jgi:molybdenum cofactor synthesis domain-containing protein
MSVESDSKDGIVTACLLIIGNEILSGRTQDANLAYIATRLNEAGVRLTEARVIPDLAETIVATVNEVRGRFDYVLTTGGIGPTHDDITSECVARAFGVPLVLDEEARRRLARSYANPAVELNAARLRMAHVPQGASLIDNPISAAPGFEIGNVFVLAGVPQIMQAMLDFVLPRLKGGAKMLARTVRCGLPEGILAEGLGRVQQRYPDLDIGSYPSYGKGRMGVALVLRGTEAARLSAATAELMAMIRELGGEPSEES